MSEEKVEMCRKFVTDPGDDLFRLVETLVDMRDEECQCVYPIGKPCTRPSACPFGFCALHVKTRRGVELAELWNQTLEELSISESSDIDEETVEEDEPAQDEETVEEEIVPEEDDEEEQVTITTRRRTPPRRPAPHVPTAPARAPARAPPQPAGRRAPPKTATRIVESPAEVKTPTKPAAAKVEKSKTPTKKEQPARVHSKKELQSEESSVAEGSAKTEYVPPPEEDEEEAPQLTFKRSKFGNFVNEEHGFVIRSTDQMILGTENSKGGIKKLTAEQKKFCRENNLNFLE